MFYTEDMSVRPVGSPVAVGYLALNIKKKKVQLYMKLEKGASTKWFSAGCWLGTSTVHGLYQEI